MTPGREALHRLIDEVLTVEPVSDDDGQADRYRGGQARQVFDRMYGGQLLGQALIAAAATVRTGLEPHSVHGCFVAAGDPAAAVDFTVQRTGDSGGFARRIMFARQGGVVLATAMCSFHAPARGFEHQQPPDPAPDPEDLVPRDVALGERFGDDVPVNAGANWPFDVRYIDRAPWGEGRSDGRNRLWMRAHDTVPDDQLLQRALLLYASDLAMFEPVVAPLDLAWEDLIAGRGAYGASLDHTVWFHRRVRVDDWLLEVQHSPIATGSRGLSIAQFYGRSGLLVATAVQEILVRAIGHESPPTSIPEGAS